MGRATTLHIVYTARDHFVRSGFNEEPVPTFPAGPVLGFWEQHSDSVYCELTAVKG